MEVIQVMEGLGSPFLSGKTTVVKREEVDTQISELNELMGTARTGAIARWRPGPIRGQLWAIGDRLPHSAVNPSQTPSTWVTSTPFQRSTFCFLLSAFPRSKSIRPAPTGSEVIQAFFFSPNSDQNAANLFGAPGPAPPAPIVLWQTGPDADRMLEAGQSQAREIEA
jgi:hypothetical protein